MERHHYRRALHADGFTCHLPAISLRLLCLLPPLCFTGRYRDLLSSPGDVARTLRILVLLLRYVPVAPWSVLPHLCTIARSGGFCRHAAHRLVSAYCCRLITGPFFAALDFSSLQMPRTVIPLRRGAIVWFRCCTANHLGPGPPPHRAVAAGVRLPSSPRRYMRRLHAPYDVACRRC